MKTIKEVLMNRDGISSEEAQTLIDECKNDMNERLEVGEMPFDICEEYFGLEPDYLMELIG